MESHYSYVIATNHSRSCYFILHLFPAVKDVPASQRKKSNKWLLGSSWNPVKYNLLLAVKQEQKKSFSTILNCAKDLRWSFSAFFIAFTVCSTVHHLLVCLLSICSAFLLSLFFVSILIELRTKLLSSIN